LPPTSPSAKVFSLVAALAVVLAAALTAASSLYCLLTLESTPFIKAFA